MKKYLLFLALFIGVALSLQAVCYHYVYPRVEPNGPVGNTPRPIKPPVTRPFIPGELRPVLDPVDPDPGFGDGILYMGCGHGPISLANLVGPGIRGYRGNTSRPIKPSGPSKPTTTGGAGSGIKISFQSASGTGNSDASQSSYQSSGQPDGGKVSSDVENNLGQSTALAIAPYSGDLNQDNAIDVSDVTLLINRILNGDIDGLDIDALDSNHDGQLDVSDVTALIDQVMQGEAPPVEKTQSAKQAISR